MLHLEKKEKYPMYGFKKTIYGFEIKHSVFAISGKILSEHLVHLWEFIPVWKTKVSKEAYIFASITVINIVSHCQTALFFVLFDGY